jgi:NADH dehydrogenase
VLIVGGGFAGLYAARELKGTPARVTLVDKRNHHLFQPLLYQVATAGLSAIDIAEPIRRILHRQDNVTVLLAEAAGVDREARKVRFTDGRELAYDYLIVAAGAVDSYFGHDEWAPYAPGLKTMEDALGLRRQILLAFERAEAEADPVRRERWLTFLVIGAGPTGAEMAGALCELARHTLKREFRNFDASDARVVLVEGKDRVLPTYPPDLSDKAERQLQDLGVEVRTGCMVDEIREGEVVVGGQILEAETIIWAAGVAASPLGSSLSDDTDRMGRVPVQADLALADHPEVFVVGDLARFEQQSRIVPGVAPAAIQMGRHAARNIRRSIQGRNRRPFRYRDRGTMATLGRKAAVAVVRSLHLSGLIAWLAWLLIHLVFLIGFRNRIVVLFEWIRSYLTFERSARLILHESIEPDARRRAESPDSGQVQL